MMMVDKSSLFYVDIKQGAKIFDGYTINNWNNKTSAKYLFIYRKKDT